MSQSTQRINDLLKERKVSLKSYHTGSQKSSVKSIYTSKLHILCDSSSYPHVRDILPTVPLSLLVERQGPHKWTPLMILCVKAPVDLIKLMIQINPGSCHVPDTSKSLPLHFVACWRRDGNEEFVIKALLENSKKDSTPQIKVVNRWGQNPLHAAFDSKEAPRLSVVKVLLGIKTSKNDYHDEELDRLHQIADDGSHLSSLSAHSGSDENREDNKHTFTMNSKSLRLPASSFSTSNEDEKKDPNQDGVSNEIFIKEKKENKMVKKKEVSPSVIVALSTLDLKSRLPLHIACENGASDEILRILVNLYPDACIVPSERNELAFHIYYDYLNTPLARKMNEVEEKRARETMEMLISPVIPIYMDYGRRRKLPNLLPLHVACEFGLSYDIISKLLQAYPKGATKRKSNTGIYPLESYLVSKAHDEAIQAKHQIDSMKETEETSSSYAHFSKIVDDFNRTSDMIFAHYPDAEPSKNSGIKLFRRDRTRIARLEKLIRKEALDKNARELSITARLVWTWMCHFKNPENPRDSYVANVGRVIENLDSSSLWKLTYIKNPSNLQKTFLKIGGPTGKTVVMEAEKRALNTTFYDMLRVSYTWQNHMLSYLRGKDALNYSCVCKHTYVTGVKYISSEGDLGGERWESSASDECTKLWKHLDLIIPSCTHSIELMYRLNEFKTLDENKSKKNSPWHSAGLKVFAHGVDFDNTSSLKEKLVPYVESRKRINDTEMDVELTFSCKESLSYDIGYFLPKSTSFISVRNLQMKQLLFCRDAERRTPFLSFLSLPEVRQSNKNQFHAGHATKAATLFQTKFPAYHLSPFNATSKSGKKTVKDSDNYDSHFLSYGINCGVSIQVLLKIISLNPTALVVQDEAGRTPLHTALLQEPKNISIELVKALLITTPGENACRFKDSTGQLPIHIAAKNGMNKEILQALVTYYADGCYRQNSDGDLPLHLLERSGKADASSLELLIRPFMGNESICRVEGSHGCDLPLHIAARYRCSFEVLEKLLRTYSDAAKRLCMRDGFEGESAMNMFERGRKEIIQRFDVSANVSVNEEIINDFNRCSDLLFVYDPMCESLSDDNIEGRRKSTIGSEITNSSTKASSIIPYRKDKHRISRISKLIIEEAKRLADGPSFDGDSNARLNDTVKLAWIWMTTYENDENDENYYDVVEYISSNLSSPALKILAAIEWNGQQIKDCALPRCKEVIINRIRFVGRYEWCALDFPLHKSDTCLIMRAKDYHAVEEYEKMRKILDDNLTLSVHEDHDRIGSEDVGIPFEQFLNFCNVLGLSEQVARQQLKINQEYNNGNAMRGRKLRASFGLGCIEEVSEEQLEEDDVEWFMEEKPVVNAAAFESFCKFNGIDNEGVRRVVIKFMLYKKQFRREKMSREQIKYNGSGWPVVPILEEYNATRKKHSRKDAQYANDIRDQDESTYDMFRYKYALVLMGADRDLGEILTHESPGILEIRDYMMQVGMALKILHNHSIIHGDLRLSNIVRFDSSLMLIDLDSSYSQPVGAKEVRDINYFGGNSHKFSSGIVSPEMLAKIELPSQQVLLDRYENYWKAVRDDAKDLDLLTPDDISNIGSVIKSIEMAYGNNFSKPHTKKDFSRGVSKVFQNASALMKPSPSILPNDIFFGGSQDWRQMISMALITISFNDLPPSLTSCKTISEFSDVWNKLLTNAELWSLVRPRRCKDGNVYIIKAYCETNDPSDTISDTSTLPFNLVQASPKQDIWAFGVLIFSMCSNGQLFSLDQDDNLIENEAYSQLYNWEKKTARSIIEERVEDPLAQDLLFQILVPDNERLESMDAVLSHPFFGSSIDLEAQRILEKHEEQQLMFEETTVITQMTSDTMLRLENSTEAKCKLIFEEEKIVVPTSLVILPYELEFEKSNMALKVPEDSYDLAVEIGKHLLDINMTTARFSFWLMMKKKMTGRESGFKKKMKKWLERARQDSEVARIVAREIVIDINCGEDYIDICHEMLVKGDSISNARNFIKDPMSTARTAIHKSTERLVQCYSSNTQFLYLVDEFFGEPVCSDSISNKDAKNEGENQETVYPINIDPDTKHFQNLFLPFMNITVMTVTAISGLASLSSLLGLPSSHGIPDKWIDATDGLIHKSTQPSSVVEFAILQDLIRKQNYQTPLPGFRPSLRSLESARSGVSGISLISEWNESLVEVGSEMMQLEIFFREYDPMRVLSSLRRMTGLQKNGLAIWTSENVIMNILEETEIARVETKLKQLKKEYYASHNLMDEIVALSKQLRVLQSQSSRSLKTQNSHKSIRSHYNTSNMAIDDDSVASTKRKKMRNTVINKMGCGGFILRRRF